MKEVKRFRLFAGPNGSGKSTLYEQLRRDGIIHTEIYISADRIEKDLKNKKTFNFNAYRIKVNESEFKRIAMNSGLAKDPKREELLSALHLEKGVLQIKDRKYINSYLAAGIAIYLANKLLQSDQSFCFETVLSHPSKIDILRKAAGSGFKTYTYFVFTDDPEKNKDRIYLVKKRADMEYLPRR
jgi:predicted ABC-type ATPase